MALKIAHEIRVGGKHVYEEEQIKSDSFGVIRLSGRRDSWCDVVCDRSCFVSSVHILFPHDFEFFVVHGTFRSSTRPTEPWTSMFGDGDCFGIRVYWKVPLKNEYEHVTHPRFFRTVGLDLPVKPCSDINGMLTMCSTNGKMLLSLIEVQLGVVGKSGRDSTTSRFNNNGRTFRVWARSPTACVSKLARISLISIFEKCHAGIRVCYMDENMTMKSFALATKLFRPEPKEDVGVLGSAVKKWNEQVLDEYGLRAESFTGAVSGTGPEVSTGITGRFRKELSISHMVNRAAITALACRARPPPPRTPSVGLSWRRRRT